MNPGTWLRRITQRSGRAGLRAGATSYYSASDKMKREAREAGRADGAAARPGATDTSLAQYEHQIVELSHQVVGNQADDMKHNDAILLADFLESRRDFQLAQRAYEGKRQELGGRPLRIEMPRWLYVVAVVVLMCGEVGVNFLAFEAIFTDNRILTATAAIALGVVLLLASHFSGVAVRQRKQRLATLTASAMVIVFTGFLAALRLAYVEAHNAEVDLFGAEMGIKLDELTVSGFFFLFNVIFLFVAAWMAAVAHDPDPDYQRLVKEYRQARSRALDSARQRDANRVAFLKDARDWIGLSRRLLALYRQENIAAREAKVTPLAWHQNRLESLIALDESKFELDPSVDIGLLHDEAFAVPPPAALSGDAARAAAVTPAA